MAISRLFDQRDCAQPISRIHPVGRLLAALGQYRRWSPVSWLSRMELPFVSKEFTHVEIYSRSAGSCIDTGQRVVQEGSL